MRRPGTAALCAGVRYIHPTARCEGNGGWAVHFACYRPIWFIVPQTIFFYVAGNEIRNVERLSSIDAEAYRPLDAIGYGARLT